MSPPLPFAEVLLRLGTAIGAAALIGINRDLRHKPAGVRTHALVALGAAAITVFAVVFDGSESRDGILRAVAGIVTGVGFLGAGVIVHSSDPKRVHGLTTAASLWVAAAIGICAGAGYWTLTWTTTIGVLVVLLVGGPLEDVVHRAVERARSARGLPPRPGPPDHPDAPRP